MLDKNIILIILSVAILALIILMIVMYPRIVKKAKKQGEHELFEVIFSGGFEMKINYFKGFNRYVIPNGIVFVGDSITQDYNVYEYFPNHRVYNRGIGGDTTVGLLTRLPCSVYELQPKTVVLLIGTNDFAMLETTPMEICERVQHIVDEILQFNPNIKIILQSIYPVNENLNPNTVLPRKNKFIVETNELLKKIKHITFVDIFNLLVDHEGNLSKDYTIEGLHINSRGYEIITESLVDLLEME